MLNLHLHMKFKGKGCEMYIWGCFHIVQPLISVHSPPNPTPPHSLQRQAYMGFYQAQDHNYANVNTSIWNRHRNPLLRSLTAYNGIGKSHMRGRLIPPTMWWCGWWRCLAVGLPRASLYLCGSWILRAGTQRHQYSRVPRIAHCSFFCLCFSVWCYR